MYKQLPCLIFQHNCYIIHLYTSKIFYFFSGFQSQSPISSNSWFIWQTAQGSQHKDVKKSFIKDPCKDKISTFLIFPPKGISSRPIWASRKIQKYSKCKYFSQLEILASIQLKGIKQKLSMHANQRVCFWN